MSAEDVTKCNLPIIGLLKNRKISDLGGAGAENRRLKEMTNDKKVYYSVDDWWK